MIDHAARTVRKQYPDAMLSVGHLSRQGGGEIDRHASHESGRDADIGFYVRNQQGKTIYADHFVPFKGDGSAPTWPGAQFDDAKNWAFVSTIASDPHARVSHIFVASPLRARLLSYAEKVGAPPAIRSRAAELMAQPKGSLPHDDHFHVRIACPSGMDQCIEQPIAKKHSHGSSKAAVASVHPSGGAHGNAKAHATPPHTPAQKPAEPKSTKPEPSSSEEPETKSEASLPNLAPMVQGLDSAVIAAPLAGAKPEKPAAPAESAPIDDPDGVLEPSSQ
jgi:penicillin-insensitive murein endopeptidase